MTPSQSHKYDIIIPHYGVGRLTDFCLRCLRSIREHSVNYRIIFIDNASEEINLVKEELKKHPHFLISNTKNLGFVKAVNEGLAVATAPYIVMLNNDTEVVANWLEALEEPMHVAGLNIGLTGPLSTALASWQGKVAPSAEWTLLSSHHMLAFFCTMFRKEVFDRCGFLDEDFGAGLGDDDHFCWKAQEAGFRLALVRSITIAHAHRTTFHTLHTPEEVIAMQHVALKMFRDKQAEGVSHVVKSA